MSHPSHDTLLLYAYGELQPAEAAGLERHLAACASCHATLQRLERARVAVDWVEDADRPSLLRRVAHAGLATAAILALALLPPTASPPTAASPGWQPLGALSPTAGYAAGGAPVIELDARLTRLEQGGRYGIPN